MTTTNNDLRIADLVRRALATVPAAGRYGTDKVFIAALWAAVARLDTGSHVKLTERGLRAWLVRGQMLGLVVMARADLPTPATAELIARSHIEDRGADFHFVLAA